MSMWERLKNIETHGGRGLTDFDFDIYQAICRAAKLGDEDITVKGLRALLENYLHADALDFTWVSIERLQELTGSTSRCTTYLMEKMMKSIAKLMGTIVFNKARGVISQLVHVKVVQIGNRMYCGIHKDQAEWGEVAEC